MVRILNLLVAVLLVCGCAASPPPLRAMDRPVDLPRFMGPWYVIASIPIVLEKGAHNAVETYRLRDDGRIETNYEFRKDSFDGPLASYHPNAIVRNPGVNTEWGMQFIWPFRATYLILYVDQDYQSTVIGVPSRRWVWLMARDPSIAEDRYQEMVRAAATAGYDVSQLQRIPHRWP